MNTGFRQRFGDALARKDHAGPGVAAGRGNVAAQVKFARQPGVLPAAAPREARQRAHPVSASHWAPVAGRQNH